MTRRWIFFVMCERGVKVNFLLCEYSNHQEPFIEKDVLYSVCCSVTFATVRWLTKNTGDSIIGVTISFLTRTLYLVIGYIVSSFELFLQDYLSYYLLWIFIWLFLSDCQFMSKENKQWNLNSWELNLQVYWICRTYNLTAWQYWI